LKFQKVLVGTIRVILAAELLAAIISEQYLNAFTALLAFLLSLFPAVMSRRTHLNLSSGIQSAIIVFIFASMYLGEIKGYYELFFWWDIMLHSISGIILGLIGFLLVFALTQNKKSDVRLSPFFIAFFAFCFAVTCGTIWEIFEYFMDTVFGMNMQKTGLDDTMWDLICDTASALATSVAGYIMAKNNLTKEGDRYAD